MNTESQIKPLILICAAGQSRRMMPRDKLMLPVNEHPMLRHIGLEIAELNYPTVAALPPHPHPRWDALDGLDILCCSFVESVEGLSGTLRAAVATIPQEITHLCVVLADLPHLRARDFINVFKAVRANPSATIWRPITASGQPAHPTVFHRRSFQAFASIKGDEGAKNIISAFQKDMISVSCDPVSGVHDIDTPEEYLEFLKQQESLAPQ